MAGIENVKYVPTQEQVEAAKARREQQQTEKAARKNKAGGKTVKSKDGTYKSVTVTPKQVEAKQKQRIAQQLKEKQHYGGKTIFDKKSGKYISQSAEEVKNIAENPKIQKKSGSLLSKLGKFGKKAGKFGLIGAGVALLIGGGIALYDKLTDSNKEEEPIKNSQEKPEPAPVKSEEPVEQEPAPAKPEEPVEKETNPAKPEEPKEKEPVSAPEPSKKEPVKSDVSTEHTVVKGDNVWNIAKQHLKDMNPDPNYKPTDAEILKHTKELMELNNLEFEPDGYHVMIRPNDKLKLVA